MNTNRHESDWRKSLIAHDANQGERIVQYIDDFNEW